jgi:hypothetical protein
MRCGHVGPAGFYEARRLLRNTETGVGLKEDTRMERRRCHNGMRLTTGAICKHKCMHTPIA